MMSLLAVVSAVATLASNVPASNPQNFNATTMAQFVARHATEAPDIGLLAASLRRCLASDPHLCMANLSEDNRTALFAAIGPMDEVSGPLVSTFASGALVVTANNNMAGLYNPVADVWLLTRWDTLQTGPVMRAAAIVDGATLRGDAAQWWQADGSFGDQLGATLKASEAAFRSHFSTGANQKILEPSVTTAAARLVALTQATKAAQSDPSISAALERGRNDLIANPREGDANMQIAGLPASVRRSVQLMTVIRRPDGLSGIFVSHLRPDLLLVVNLDAQNHVQGLTPIALPEVQP